MAIDLSFLPVQKEPVATDVDLSFLPVQKEGPTDLSFLPVQPKTNSFMEGIQKAGANIKNFVSAGSDPAVLDEAVRTSDQSGIDREMAGITRREFNPFNPEKDTAGGAIGSMLTEDLPKFVNTDIPNFLDRTKEVRDPNIMFPMITAGRAGDIGFHDMVAPMTSQSARLTGQKFKEGKFGQGVLQAALTAGAIPADILGTGVAGIVDVLGNAIDLGRAKYKQQHYSKFKHMETPEIFKHERTTDESIGESEEKEWRNRSLSAAMADIESGKVTTEQAAKRMAFELSALGFNTDIIELFLRH